MMWTGKFARRVASVGLGGCLVAAAGLLSASAAPALPAAPHAAASHLSLDFYELTGVTKVVTSSHVHRSARLDATYFPQGGGFAARPRSAQKPVVEFNVTLTATGDTESNEWDFSLPGSVLSASPTKGTGRMATGSKLAPYGAIHMTLTPMGKLRTQNICAEERVTTRVVQLSGHLLFGTGPGSSHSLGAVGSRHHRFTLHATITARYDKPNSDPKCETPGSEPCPSAVSVEYHGPQQSDGSNVGFTASPIGGHNVLTGYRDVDLAKPKGAQRVDEVTTRAEPLAITPAQQGTSVTVAAGGPRAAGSATLDDGAAPSTLTTDFCKHPSNETFYNATLDPTISLRFHNKLAGTFAIPYVFSSGVYYTYQRS